MYTNDKIMCLTIFILVSVLSCLFMVTINNVIIIIFGILFSVLFGFYIAAISVIFGSAYSKKLYKKIDDKIPIQTSLHTLRYYFNACLTWVIIFLVMIIISSLQDVLTPNLPLWVDILWNSLILAVTAINLYLSTRILKIFLIGLVIEAKENDQENN